MLPIKNAAGMQQGNRLLDAESIRRWAWLGNNRVQSVPRGGFIQTTRQLPGIVAMKAASFNRRYIQLCQDRIIDHRHMNVSTPKNTRTITNMFQPKSIGSRSKSAGIPPSRNQPTVRLIAMSHLQATGEIYA